MTTTSSEYHYISIYLSIEREREGKWREKFLHVRRFLPNFRPLPWLKLNRIQIFNSRRCIQNPEKNVYSNLGRRKEIEKNYWGSADKWGFSQLSSRKYFLGNQTDDRSIRWWKSSNPWANSKFQFTVRGEMVYSKCTLSTDVGVEKNKNECFKGVNFAVGPCNLGIVLLWSL